MEFDSSDWLKPPKAWMEPTIRTSLFQIRVEALLNSASQRIDFRLGEFGFRLHLYLGASTKLDLHLPIKKAS